MDSITPMYDIASRKKSPGRFETVLLPNCGEVSCNAQCKSYFAFTICYTSKIAKLVRWLHLQVMFRLELLPVIHPSDDHPP